VPFVAHDDFPKPHFPFFDQAAHDVRVFAREFFDFALVIDAKNNQRAVNRVVESAAENQFSAVASLASDSQMLFPEFRAALNIVIYRVID